MPRPGLLPLGLASVAPSPRLEMRLSCAAQAGTFARILTMLRYLHTPLVVVLLSMVAACAAPRQAAPTPAPGPEASPTPIDRWSELLQHTPHAFSTPLPPPEPSPIDGVYTKTVIKDEPTVHCRRCPDYAPEGGLWKLSLDDGIFRIYHAETGWRSLASFTVEGSALNLFNDPNCFDLVGRYAWALEEGQLVLTVIDDPCAIALRAMNLTQLPWKSCQPPNQEAAISGHWPVPEGCT